MNTVEFVICKAVVTKSFPDRGWIGVVEPVASGSRLAGLYTRSELYREVQNIMNKYGENEVRLGVTKFKVPAGYSLMFASSRDAYDTNHARTLIEKHIRK